MNWYEIFYLFGVADKVSTIFGILSWLCGIGLGITLFFLIGSEKMKEDDWKLWRKFFFTFMITTFISITFWTFIPDKKQMTLIIAGGAVGEFVVNDENAKKLPADVMAYLRAEVNKATAELDIKDLGLQELDTLKEKSKEELMQIIKDQKK